MFILWLQWCGKRFKCDDGDCPFRGGMIQNHGYNRFSCFSCDFDLCDSCVHRKLFVLTKVVQRQSNHVRSLLCGTLHSGKWRWLQYSLPCYKIRPNHLGACQKWKSWALKSVWPDRAIFALWATIKSSGNNYFSGFAHIVMQFFVQVSKSFTFLVKLFLGNFYRHLEILIWSHWIWNIDYFLSQ